MTQDVVVRNTDAPQWWGMTGREEGGCLRWLGPARLAGSARSVSWQLEHGALPGGAGLVERCGSPWCINPDHMDVAV